MTKFVANRLCVAILQKSVIKSKPNNISLILNMNCLLTLARLGFSYFPSSCCDMIRDKKTTTRNILIGRGYDVESRSFSRLVQIVHSKINIK